MRKGERLIGILTVLGEAAMTSSDLLNVLLTSPYGTSYSGLKFNMSKQQKLRNERSAPASILQSYYTAISKLRRDGLIETGDGGRHSITRRGLAKLAQLKKKMTKSLPDKRYKITPAFNYTIITFDILEKERRKRDWLREALNNLGLKQLQKSVWLGKVKLPQEFIRDLHHLRLADYVEIFEITKSGTLKNIV